MFEIHFPVLLLIPYLYLFNRETERIAFLLMVKSNLSLIMESIGLANSADTDKVNESTE